MLSSGPVIWQSGIFHNRISLDMAWALAHQREFGNSKAVRLVGALQEIFTTFFSFTTHNISVIMDHSIALLLHGTPCSKDA